MQAVFNLAISVTNHGIKKDYIFYNLLTNKRIKVNFMNTNNGQSTVNYCQSSVFERPYLSCNDHCDQWLFQEIFFINIIFISQNSFE